MKAYWFEPADGKLGYGDGRKPVKGKTHKIDCAPILCLNGLHASIRAIDALKYAESNIVWEVELSGNIVQGEDKCAASERTYLRRIDAEAILFECACRFALSVAHLWDMPPVVREFLETGNKDLRDAADAAARHATSSAAARDGARDAEWAAARDGAWAAARAASRDAAWDAAWAAARAAAWATSWAASWAASSAASWAASSAASWAASSAASSAAARDGASAAASAAARDAAWAEMNTLLQARLEDA